MKRFADRADAGRELAARLAGFADREDVVVLGLARGGVPVAAAVAAELHVPFDAFAVRKLGVPWQEELAFGAVASGGVRVLNREVVRELPLPREAIEEIAEREAQELVRREAEYRGDRPPRAVAGRTVVLVDDGIATGSSMRAAVAALRSRGPAAIVVAVPVAPPETVAALAAEVDAVVCVATPDPFRAVGVWYRRFDQCSDEEVRRLLAT
jgi:predicted phosphoribosyltransferase